MAWGTCARLRRTSRDSSQPTMRVCAKLGKVSRVKGGESSSSRVGGEGWPAGGGGGEEGHSASSSFVALVSTRRRGVLVRATCASVCANVVEKGHEMWVGRMGEATGHSVVPDERSTRAFPASSLSLLHTASLAGLPLCRVHTRCVGSQRTQCTMQSARHFPFRAPSPFHLLPSIFPCPIPHPSTYTSPTHPPNTHTTAVPHHKPARDGPNPQERHQHPPARRGAGGGPLCPCLLLP